MSERELLQIAEICKALFLLELNARVNDVFAGTKPVGPEIGTCTVTSAFPGIVERHHKSSFLGIDDIMLPFQCLSLNEPELLAHGALLTPLQRIYSHLFMRYAIIFRCYRCIKSYLFLQRFLPALPGEYVETHGNCVLASITVIRAVSGIFYAAFLQLYFHVVIPVIPIHYIVIVSGRSIAFFQNLAAQAINILTSRKYCCRIRDLTLNRIFCKGIFQ